MAFVTSDLDLRRSTHSQGRKSFHFLLTLMKNTSKVRDFLESFVPVSQNEQDSLSEAFTDVKEAADKISSIGQEGFNPCAKLISSVTEDTMGLGATVVAANALLKKEVKQILPDLKLEIDILVQDMESNHELLYRLGEKNQQEIASLTTETTNTDMTPTKIDSLPLKTSAEAMKIFSAIRRISDFFGGEAAFKENQQALGRKAIELGELEKAIEERSVKVESTLIENYALLDEISQLVDKIEGFGAMLEKVCV
ncbi:hypothetical protein BDZ97DRAFT_805364 [Flammula alnicola]|nr:hypothetical protein BDZ97DRAFT_805364 [Flammula alnicola]